MLLQSDALTNYRQDLTHKLGQISPSLRLDLTHNSDSSHPQQDYRSHPQLGWISTTKSARSHPQLGQISPSTWLQISPTFRLDLTPTRLDLIHNSDNLTHTRLDLTHNSTIDLTHNSARSHPHSARSHTQPTTRLDLTHTRLHLMVFQLLFL